MPRPIRRLDGVERMYLALESPTTPMHFGALVVLDGSTLVAADGRLRIDEIRGRIEARLARVPELRRIVHWPGPLAGGPIWIDDPTMRITDHVGRMALPPGPGDDDAILAFVERLMTEPLDRSRPLWRLWFITGLPAGHVGILFICHHSLADGLGAMRLARALLGDEATEGDLAAGPTPDGAIPPWRALLVDHVRGLLAGAGLLARPATRRAIRAVVRSFLRGAKAARHEPVTSLNAEVGRHRRTAVIRLDAAAVKRAARADGAGANDLVLTLVAGGIRALLASREESIERRTVRAGIAVALPPSARGGDERGNQFGSYAVALPVAEPDPRARLRRIAVDRATAKRTQSITGVTAVRVWTTRFRWTRSLMARQRFIQVMETLVPGPPNRIELLDAPVLDLVPLQPLGRDVGLTFLAATYAGRLTLVVRTDPEAFPDLDVVVTAIRRDWGALDAEPAERTAGVAPDDVRPTAGGAVRPRASLRPAAPPPRRPS